MDFDPDDLLSRTGGDRQLAIRVLDRFLSDIPAQLSALAKAVEGRDGGSGAEAAHAIRGAAANVGGSTLAALAATLERLCRAGALDAVAELAPEVTAVFARSHAAITNFRSEHTGTLRV